MEPLIKKQRAYQTVIDQLKIAIEHKELLPGDKLPSERILAAKLAVSRTTVKEAFSVLESTGIIEIKHGSGATLLKGDTEDIITKINRIISRELVDIVELIELRQSIEGDAAYYAAKRCNEEDLEKLHQAYMKLKNAVKTNKIAAKEDLNFHICIARIARNSLIIEVMYMISDRLLQGLKESRANSFEIPGKSEMILDEHYRIYLSIHDKKPELAREIIRNHLEKVKQRYLS